MREQSMREHLMELYIGKANCEQVSEFILEGWVDCIEYKHRDVVKRIHLMNAQGSYRLKLAKSLRSILPPLKHRDLIRVIGNRTLDLEQQTYKFKAEYIWLLGTENPALHRSAVPASSNPLPCGKILVCQKSDCWKRGGKEAYRALEETLARQGLTDRVEVKKTGCLKHCKAGPNLIVLPDKTHYTQVRSGDMSKLVAQHFPLELGVGC
jgi:(2Fe-2S) ferredoxin